MCRGAVIAPLSFLAKDAIDLIDQGICSGFITPGFCDRRINATVRTSVDNNNVALGIVPAMDLRSDVNFVARPAAVISTPRGCDRIWEGQR